ncbi:MAG: lasso peptide isopeptide bond-forming cyclase [Gemmatimonadaceae bacterium]
MSAICGVCNLDGRPTQAENIRSMAAALEHRGPDGFGVWSGPSESLAHRLLRTTPESLAEVQPIIRREEQLVLVADARLDNRDELIRLLRPRTSLLSDGELILESYATWGENCVERLIGDFAFAVWDGRARTLFCARDPMGVKPFYYYYDSRRFAFASEIKSLFVLQEVRRHIDPEQVALFVGWHHEERERTLYSDVRRLPAAHALLLSREKMVVRRYWSADSAPDVRFSTDDQYVEAFHETFATAVAARLRSAHLVGATLSGGLDSSSIVCMSRKLRGSSSPPLHTFSLIFPGLPEKDLRLIDEREFIDSVARLGGLQPHYVRGDELSPMRDVRRMLWHLDEPYSTPNLYLHCGLFEAAQANGLRVLLDGFDGDSAVSHGFGRLTSLARTGHWDVLDAEVRAFSAHHGKAPELALQQFVLPSLAQFAREGRLLSWVRMATELARRFGMSRRELLSQWGLRPFFSFLGKRDVGKGARALEDAILRPSLARGLSRHRKLAAREDARSGTDSERATHIKGLSQPMYQLTLEIADKSAAAFGIEPRYPFFDRRLIAFCVGLPESQKFGAGWPRLLFRRAMQDVLPPQVQWRGTKANLSPNFHQRFRGTDLPVFATPREHELSQYLNDEALSAMLERYRAEPEAPRTSETAALLFRVAVLALWLEEAARRSDHSRPERAAPSPAAA